MTMKKEFCLLSIGIVVLAMLSCFEEIHVIENDNDSDNYNDNKNQNQNQCICNTDDKGECLTCPVWCPEKEPTGPWCGVPVNFEWPTIDCPKGEYQAYEIQNHGECAGVHLLDECVACEPSCPEMGPNNLECGIPWPTKDCPTGYFQDWEYANSGECLSWKATGICLACAVGDWKCTVGQDQTCNDYLEISSLWGHCQDNGSCECNMGYEINPDTGRCRQLDEEDCHYYTDDDCPDYVLQLTNAEFCENNTLYICALACSDACECDSSKKSSKICTSSTEDNVGVCLESPQSGVTECNEIPLLPESLKGYELYSWLYAEQQGGQPYWFFTLLSGTNRIKTCTEILNDETVQGVTQSGIYIEDGLVKITVLGLGEITSVLSALPANEQVLWIGPQDRENTSAGVCGLQIPNEAILHSISETCANKNIRLLIGN